MATLHFGSTDVKVFTPISAALANLSNGSGTIIILVKRTASGPSDYGGLVNSAGSTWYHTISHGASDQLYNDDISSAPHCSTSATVDTSNWWLYATDWPGGAAALSDLPAVISRAEPPRCAGFTGATRRAWGHGRTATRPPTLPPTRRVRARADGCGSATS